ncbi:MAG: penicillin-binding protein activator LpoB [Candidatus Euphemobacter frigidus]|nr:penicillin-binding protein activator LpoB [Candidatus Euphemobacter frigidus]MDP8275424.1 penicillin-binding protein activator LpoB [Candidatus Euphemobacter frigidus]
MQKIKTGFPLLLAIAALAALAGCSTTYDYGDAGDVPVYDTDFGATDLQQIAAKMTTSLLIFPPIVQITNERRPVIVVEKVKNKTTQHIDTESVTDSIRTKLIRSGKFRFLDKSTDGQTISEIKRQQEQGLTKQSQAAQFGTQEGAEFILTANLSEISQKKEEFWNKKKAVYYKFTMNLKNLRTGILEWSDEKEISKLKTDPRFGY